MRFVRIATSDMPKMVEFINENKTQLFSRENAPDLFLEEAIVALADQNGSRAKSCIEKSIIIDDCREMNGSTMTMYLALMHKQEPQAKAEFQKKFARRLEQCRAQASSGGRVSALATVREDTGRGPGAETGRDYQTMEARHTSYATSAPRPIPQKRASVDTVSRGSVKSDQEDRHTLSHSMQSMNISKAAYSMSPQARHSNDLPQGQRPAKVTQSKYAPDQGKEARPDVDPGGGSHGWRTLIGDRSGKLPDHDAATFEGPATNAPTEDPRDSSYIRRSPRDAGSFFKVGRVFAILLHAERTGPPGPRTNIRSVRVNQHRDGSTVISRISRFVVVKRGHGHSWCIPISTYNGQGVAKRGFRQVDIDAHAIVYSGESAPGRLAREPAMIKRPLAVECSRGQRLDPASRVDFSKVHTVEHNVRAQDIGMIRESSYRRFMDYWEEEVSSVKTEGSNSAPARSER